MLKKILNTRLNNSSDVTFTLKTVAVKLVDFKIKLPEQLKIKTNEPEGIASWRSSCGPRTTGASFAAAERLLARPRSCRTCLRTAAASPGPCPTPEIEVCRTGRTRSSCRSAAARDWLKLEFKIVFYKDPKLSRSLDRDSLTIWNLALDIIDGMVEILRKRC